MEATLFYEKRNSCKRVPLEKIAETIRSGKQEKRVAGLRNKLEHSLPETVVKQTSKLPVVCFGSVLRKKEGKPTVAGYNGLILLSIGRLASLQEAMQLRQQAAESLQTLFAFIGSSGKSVKIVVPFLLPDGSLPQNESLIRFFHAHARRRAAAYYQEQLQRNMTNQQGDPTSGCRLSSDPGMYYNPDALPIRMEQPWAAPGSQPVSTHKDTENDPIRRLAPGLERDRIISLLFENSLQNTLDTTGLSTQKNDFKPFLTLLSENCFRSGIPEEDTIRWIFVHTQFLPFDTEVRATVRNVYRLSSGFGEKPCMRPEQTLILQTDEFMKRRYEFRHNLLKEDVEVRERRSGCADFLPVGEQILNSIALNAQAEGIPLWDRDVKRYVYSDRIADYSPVEAYLKSLPTWDGQDRIRQLADSIPCQNDEWRNQFYVWFLSMVAHWLGLDSLHANSCSPLLVGRQGCGKSTWCRNLLPPELRDFYTDSIDFSNKRDAELSLNRFLLINIDEFDSVSPSHQAFLKHVLQKPVINTRQPYKRSIRPLRRYASFIATSNNSDLLSDPTGSRRFICIEINGYIPDALRVDHKQLYAQAASALGKNERFWFTPEEETVIIRNNHQFEQTPIEEQLFFQYFRIPEIGEVGEVLPAAEILRRIESRSKIKSGIRNMALFGRLLLKNKVCKTHTRTGNYYHVIETA